MGFQVRSVSSNATYGDDFSILADSTAGNLTLNLPAASNSLGRTYVAKYTGSSNTVTILPNASDTIEGVASIALTAANEVRVFQSDGNTNWFLIVA